jgi:sigma-B regulation protein RsbU (phosphoserine phosphatase)
MDPRRTYRHRKATPTARLLRSEVRAITRLQHHLLPRVVPQPPGWRVAAYSLLGAWPGGDFYDFLPLPDGRLASLVADASGHGAPAAVLVAQLRTLLHSCPFRLDQGPAARCPRWGAVPRPGAAVANGVCGPRCSVGWCPGTQPPPVILARLSRILEANSLPEQFLTAFLGVLSPGTGLLRFANAGHPPPRWWHASGRSMGPLENGAGPPLGLGVPGEYGQGAVSLQPDDVLACYTDGLTDAQDGGRGFGVARLDAAIREAAPQGAEAVKSHVLAAFDGFLAGQSTGDDVTLARISHQGYGAGLSSVA